MKTLVASVLAVLALAASPRDTIQASETTTTAGDRACARVLEASLKGAGWSFSECAGYCVADIGIDGDDLLLTGGRWVGEEPLYANRGRLTPEGRARLDVALATLGGVWLDPVYGCPDCADGGAAYLELAREGVVERIELEFSAPPDVLAELYAVSATVMDALETCRSNGLVDVATDCVHYQGS